jgi:hypothetical protein
MSPETRPFAQMTPGKRPLLIAKVRLYQAMKRIVEDKELADRLSSNAVLLREELSLENIAKKWMELV